MKESAGQSVLDWRYHYAALLEYYKEHGTCNVPNRSNYECDLPDMGEDGSAYHYKGNLGIWLTNQRQAKKGKANGTLLPARDYLLQKLVDEGDK